MQGLAVVNPRASSFDRPRVDRCLRTLGSVLDLDVVETTAPRHAEELAAKARAQAADVVVVLGGDGTVNEALCGLLADPLLPAPPLLASLPFGCVNVFSRHLGLGSSPGAAAEALAERLGAGARREIGVGHVATTTTGGSTDSRWFCLSVGIGFDADVVAAVERRRADGRPASTMLYARCGVAEFYRREPRPRVALSVEGRPVDGDAEVLIVGNHAPWTYAGNRPIWANPEADWQRGLDAMTLARLSTVPTLRHLTRMIRRRRPAARDGHGVRHHLDLSELTVSARLPTRWQVDGDAMPAASGWTITAHASAVSVPM
jgi:diacylglycerol kinase family enzyme